jgi:hypothetical protein
MKIPPERLLVEIEDLLRSMPPRENFPRYDLEIQEWLGRAQAIVEEWSPLKLPLFQFEVGKLHHTVGYTSDDGFRAMLRTLHQARFDLRMKTVGPLSIAVQQGGVFDYFDEIRKVIEEASIDLLFIDPYLDAEFVARYLPHVKAGISVRLLTEKRIPSLTPAVHALRQQNGVQIEVRASTGLHDRYLFLDRSSCYQSGASFKDGAKKAPTTLTQIVDAFAAIHATYDNLWNSGSVIP